MRSNIIKVVFPLAAALGLWLVLGAQSSLAVNNVDVKQAQLMSDQGALLLDVREPSEYAEGHAPNAVLIPLGQLSARMQEIASYKDKPVVVMCRSGRRSAKATNMLQEAGYSQARNISGGIKAWKNEGLEVIKEHSHVST